MTQLWPGGQPITVDTDAEGRPSSFRWQGQPYTLQGIAVQWRVDEEWWTQRIYRQYYKVYTADVLVEIFQDLLTGQWFIEKKYD